MNVHIYCVLISPCEGGWEGEEEAGEDGEVFPRPWVVFWTLA
jgi:hypothetical protein